MRISGSSRRSVKKLSETRRAELKLEPGEKVTWAGDVPRPLAEMIGELVGRLDEAEALLGRIDMAYTIGRGVESTMWDIREYVGRVEKEGEQDG